MSTSTGSPNKSRILIFGGTGFIGRHLLNYLLSQDVASKIRIVDKTPHIMAYMSPEFQKLYENPIVECKQGNCSNAVTVKKMFAQDEGEAKFNYVINLAAETRYGQEETVYKQMVFNISTTVAKEAESYGVEKYIELSTAQVYEAGKKASAEKSKLKPWTKLAKYKQQAEEEIKKMKNLKWVILRPAIVYGPGDMNGLAPRIMCATTYTKSKQLMKLLWTGDLRIDTVHVSDVAKAIWLCTQKAAPGTIYNLADKSSLTQKKLSEVFQQIFGIETGYWGSMLSSLAQLKIKEAAETANETHMNPWSELLKESAIVRTPLSPYIDVELLYNTPLAIDGSLIEKELGFKYDVPNVTEERINEFITYWTHLGLYPKFEKIVKKK